MSRALSIDTHKTGSTSDVPDLEALILREQAASLFSTIRPATYSDSVVTVVFGLLMYWQTHQLVIFPWIALHLCTLLRMPLMTAYFVEGDADRHIRHWIDTYCHELRLNTAGWGLAPVLFLPDSIPLTSIVTLVIMGFCMGGGIAVAPLRRATYNLVLPMMLGLILGLLLRPSLLNLALASFCVAFLIAVLRFTRAQHELLSNALRARFEKAALAERLEEQMRATERASQEKTRFLAAASHDLRQPLHAIALLGAALEKELADRPEQRNASRLMRAVDTLRHSLDTMLDVSRLDAGVVVAERQAVGLHGLFQSLNQSFVSVASEKDIQLRVRSSPLWVNSDPQLLRRMLSNLIDNAIKYTQRGGVLVVARLGRPRVDNGLHDAEVWIEVYDSGIGIAPEQQARIFEEFYQVGNPGRDRSLGLGIGLSIVRRLSLLLAHPVELRSVPGRGSRFRVRLPMARPACATVFADDQSLSLLRSPPPARLPGRVLLLDDEADVREAMIQLLHAHGIEADAVATEAEATMLLQASVKALRPAMLICDFRLANGVDGLKVGQSLSQRFFNIPLLLITGETAPERLQRVREAGVPVLFKPVNAERLLQAMTTAFGVNS